MSLTQNEDALNGAGDFSLCEWLLQRRVGDRNPALSAGQVREKI